MFIDADNGGGGGGYEPRNRYYILDGRTPRAVPMMIWAVWFASSNRHVGLTKHRGLVISTVFLGIDSSISGPPQLFETMLFSGALHRAKDLESVRAYTWEQAKFCHHKMVRIARMMMSGRGRARCAKEARRAQPA